MPGLALFLIFVCIVILRVLQILAVCTAISELALLNADGRRGELGSSVHEDLGVMEAGGCPRWRK